MPNALRTDRFGLSLARAVAVAGVVVLICVPTLTRMGQRLETASLAPSFAKNIDCPPKKVTITPAPMASPALLNAVEPAPVARLAPPRDLTLPRSPFLFLPRPLRAPPSTRLA